MDHPRPIFSLFWVFQTNNSIFTTNVKNVRPVYRAGMRTHDLLNTNLLT